MKNLVLSFILIVFSCSIPSKLAAKSRVKLKSDSLVCLQIEGKILNNDDGSDEDCIIELISIEDGIDTIVLSEGRSRFKFLLKKNMHYGIRLTKVGYVAKLVCVNTELLTQTDDLYRFLFETKLIKKETVKRLNMDVLDFPVAIVYYDYDRDGFFHSEEYTESIKNELHKIRPSMQITRVTNHSKRLTAN